MDPAAIRDGLIKYIILVACICMREWAQAFAADRLGDDTPRLQGRVTFNPVAHFDVLGTAVFPLISIFVFGGIPFGWGRPLLMNISNFAKPKRDHILSILAGPLANYVFALLAAIIGGLVYRFDPNTPELFIRVIEINVLLIVFNLIPVPPLDGGQILRHVVGMSEETFYSISRFSFLILFVLLNYVQPFRVLFGMVSETLSIPLMIVYNLFI